MKKGFTVLEFLVVLTILVILIGLVLVGLTRVRSRARDEEKISRLQSVVVALEQYHDICREYPMALSPAGQTTCPALGANSFETLAPGVDIFLFNDPASDYYYSGLTLADGSISECVSYHIGVRLENSDAGTASQKSDFNLLTFNQTQTQTNSPQYAVCGPGVDFDGTLPDVFDIRR
jgi:prepilin-type N-terminal cleavage/methylation domain-containing protein